MKTAHAQRSGAVAEAPVYDSLRFGLRAWAILVVLCIGQFLVVLDFSIVNVALPAIQYDLHFSPQDLQWVVSAYALMQGGFLLLGGRAGDMFGRRALLLLGLALFLAASLLGGAAPSQSILLLARALQGLGAALIVPNAFALLASLFAEGEARNKAFGIFGAVVASALVMGNLLGGLLTAGPGWRWVFFINVPIAAAALLGAPKLLPGDALLANGQRLDLPGALVGAAGLTAFVYVLAQGAVVGWGAPPVLGMLALSLACMVGFVRIELRAPQPLVRLGIFRLRTLACANLISLLAPGTFGAMMILLALYMQQALGYTPFVTGLAFLPLALTIALTSSTAVYAIAWFGLRRVLMAGLSLMALGLLLLLRVAPDAAYTNTVLPGMLLVCLGMGPTFTILSILGTSGVAVHEQGLAAGLLNTTQQIGHGLVLAVMMGIAARVAMQQAGGHESIALIKGIQAAFMAGVGIAVLALAIAFIMLPATRQRD